MEFLLDPNSYVALLSLVVMLLILDVDNVVFLSILSSNLPQDEQRKVRNYGLLISMVTRGFLVAAVGYLSTLKEPLLTVLEFELSVQDLIVLLGGVFLIYKSTTEIHNKLEGPDPEASTTVQSLGRVLVSVFILNLVFSIDSVITAVGMTQNIYLMVTAIVISLFVIFLFQGRIAGFVQKHPTTKVLALSFLLLIGVFLVVEALHMRVPKGYIYFAMAFSLLVELINLRVRKQGKPVHLHGPQGTLEKMK